MSPPREIPVELHGFLAVLPPEYSGMFEASAKETQFSQQKRTHVTRVVRKPLWREREDGQISVPFGMILFILKNDPSVKFKITRVVNAHKLEPLSLDPWPQLAGYLRPFQAQAFDSVRGKRGGLVESVTGSGKSCMELCVTMAASRQHNVFYMAPGATARENFLEEQAKVEARIGSRLEGFEVIWHAELRKRMRRGPVPQSGLIVVSGAQEITNDAGCAAGRFDSFGSVVSDEAHRWESNIWQDVFYALPNLVRSIGFSGTLFEGKPRTDVHSMELGDANIIAACGPVLMSVGPQDAADWLSLPDVVDYQFDWKESEVCKVNSWLKVYKSVKGNARRRAAIGVVVDVLSRLGRTTLIPVKEKAYAVQLLEGCQADRACCWFGGGSVVERGGRERQMSIDEVREAVESGHYTTLFVTSHVDESLDIPAINTTFLTEGKKARRMRQRVGRAIRKSDAKTLVVNLWDGDRGIMQSQSSFRSRNMQDYYKAKVHKVSDAAGLEAAVRSYDNPDKG
jgi:superfamily II DNA or RNA helicase